MNTGLNLRKNKTRKGWTLTALLLITVLVLSACGSKATTDNGGNAAAPASNELEQIKSAGVIKVGMMGTYRPYNFLNDKKEMDGFDADIAREVAKRLGVEVEFVSQEFSGLTPSLQSKKLDAIISQMTITDERKKALDFSDPYITNSVKIIVKEDNNDITTLEDFKGKTIGVGLGTNDETYLRNEVLPKVV